MSNTCHIAGYVQKATKYTKNEKTDEFEYRFYLYSYNQDLEKWQTIPCKCSGWIADQSYANLSEKCFVEAWGSVAVSDNNRIYIEVDRMIYKKPKTRREYYIKKKDFLQYYEPTSVIERVVKKGAKKN